MRAQIEHEADFVPPPYSTGARVSLAPSPPADTFEIVDIGDIAKDKPDTTADGLADIAGGEQISAADYDPSLDRREDEEKRVRCVIGKDAAHTGGDKEVEMIDVEEEEEEEDDDVEDMFALEPTEKKKKKRKVKKVTVRVCFA